MFCLLSDIFLSSSLSSFNYVISYVGRKCKRVHLEAYTSILCYGLDKSKLEEFYGREVIEADRTVVEQNSGRTHDFRFR